VLVSAIRSPYRFTAKLTGVETELSSRGLHSPASSMQAARDFLTARRANSLYEPQGNRIHE